jgi:hypothetical protein
MFKHPPTFADVCAALEALRKIERPDGDNEGDPVNAPSVFEGLSEADQDRVRKAEEYALDFTRDPGGAPNRRGLADLRNRKFEVRLDQDQYDPYRLSGVIGVGDWELDISDAQADNEGME